LASIIPVRIYTFTQPCQQNGRSRSHAAVAGVKSFLTDSDGTIMTRAGGSVASLIVASVLGLGVVVDAQAPPRPAVRFVPPAPIPVGRLVSTPEVDVPGSFTGLPGTRTVEIVGVVQNHTGAVVPNAGTIVIRDLFTGAAVGTTPVNGAGQFVIRSLPPGTYAVELVDASGKVVATSPAFTANPGDVIQLAQTVPVVSDTRDRILQSATRWVLTTAASSGVIALSPGAPMTPGS
jgi:hypothetical protein